MLKTFSSFQPTAPMLLLLHPFNGLFTRTTWVSWHQKGKISMDLNDARDDGVLGCSGISWTICKQSAPHTRQTTTPTPHHSVFTAGQMLLLTPNQQCQSTEGSNAFNDNHGLQQKCKEQRAVKDTDRPRSIVGILEANCSVTSRAAILALHVGKHDITCPATATGM